MVFLLDSIIEYFTDNPQDFETLIVVAGVCLFLFGVDLIIGAVITSKVIEFIADVIDPCK